MANCVAGCLSLTGSVSVGDRPGNFASTFLYSEEEYLKGFTNADIKFPWQHLSCQDKAAVLLIWRMKITLWFHGSIISLMLTLLAVRTAHLISAIKCCFACSLMEKKCSGTDVRVVGNGSPRRALVALWSGFTCSLCYCVQEAWEIFVTGGLPCGLVGGRAFMCSRWVIAYLFSCVFEDLNRPNREAVTSAASSSHCALFFSQIYLIHM